MASEQTEETQGKLRRLNLEIVFGSISAIGALLVANDAESWPEGLLLTAGLGATLVVVHRWNVGAFSRIALPGLIATAAVWLVGVMLADAATSSYGFAIVAAITVAEQPRHRKAVIAAISAFSIALLGSKLVLAREDVVDALMSYVVGSLGIAVAGVVLAVLAYAVHTLISEMEQAREREAEMAVMRERVRFAGDLHDIQGHTLHVVKLKIALAKKLLHNDIARAEEELDEVHALVGDTINQTRDLAYAQRQLNLSAELENAKNLFEAAGISVRVDREAEVDASAGELLGQVLRETTTNILRHAEAEHVWITLSETGISVANDGAGDERAPGLGGLAALRDRLESQGGELTVEQRDGLFTTVATSARGRRGAAAAAGNGSR